MTSRAAISAQQQIGVPPKTHRFRVLGVDPAVAGAMKHVDLSTETRLERLLSEIRGESRRATTNRSSALRTRVLSAGRRPTAGPRAQD